MYEWDGDDYILRRRGAADDQSRQQTKWEAELSPQEWREIFLQCCASDVDVQNDHEFDELVQELQGSATAAFSDGVNTGFYINSYTTKQCPSMDGVLEEMRKGLERLQHTREVEQDRIKKELEQQGADAEKYLTTAERKALKGRSPFAQTMDVLKRLSASYRRCYWKSGSEMLFPILFGHLTFASHRCWTVFIKKAVFLASEAWRTEYGTAVRPPSPWIIISNHHSQSGNLLHRKYPPQGSIVHQTVAAALVRRVFQVTWLRDWMCHGSVMLSEEEVGSFSYAT